MSLFSTQFIRLKQIIHSTALSDTKEYLKIMSLRIMAISLILFFAIFISLAQGQAVSPIQKILNQLEEYPEVYLSIPRQSFDLELAGVASLDYFHQNRAYLYANKEAFAIIVRKKIAFQPEKSPGSVDFDLNMLVVEAIGDKDLSDSWDFYPTYDAYVALMYQFENDFPDLVKIHQIGTTVMGRSLLFAQIGPDVQTPRPVPQFMYTSTMHGDETAGFVILLRLIHHLASQYGNDSEITKLMDGLEIWICPNENPDGTYTDNNSTVSGATRSNANGIDLNRNYPNPHPNPPIPPSIPVQPETQAMIDFVEGKNFVMSANLHGGIELVNFPYDAWKSTQKKHADHKWWELVMNEYVDTVHAYSPSGYMTDQNGGVTHGGDWYVVYGSRQDYMNYFHSCREFTLELSTQKLLSPELLQSHWDYNYRSLINYMHQANYGIHGFVRGEFTVQPVFATIELIGHDQDNSQVTTSTPYGNFARPVLAGTYDVRFIADGYPDGTMTDLVVNDYEKIELDIYLGENTFPVYVYSENTEKGKASGAGIYPYGYNVTISALPNTGYEFLYWRTKEDLIVSHEPDFSFNMSAVGVVYYAVFDEKTSHVVNFETGTGSGSVTATIDNNEIDSGYLAYAGSDIVFIAYPNKGYNVVSWMLNDSFVQGDVTDVYRVENITYDLDLITNFVLTDYLLTVNILGENAGNVLISPAKLFYTFGQEIMLTAMPGSGYVFDSWMDVDENVISHDEIYTFTMPANNIEITALFKLPAQLSDLLDESSLRVYPNPASNLLFLEADFLMEKVEVLDESGRIVFASIISSEKRTSIPLNALSSGFYLLRVSKDRGAVVKKLQVY